MKKRMVRRLTLFLTLVLLLGLLPAGALATETAAPFDASELVFYVEGDKEPRSFAEGEITPLEDGFTLDYAKMYNRLPDEMITKKMFVTGKNVPSYKNSVFEFDLNVHTESSNFMRILFASRMTDSAAVEGIDIDRTNQFLYLNGPEWGNLPNLSNVRLAHNKEFHCRVVTKNDQMELYIDGTLASRTGLRNLEAGICGWLVWGSYSARDAGKKITVRNIACRELTTSGLNLDSVNVKAAAWGKEDVKLPLTLDEGDSIVSVKNGETLLEENQWRVEGTDLVLTAAYVAAQKDTFPVTVSFRQGTVDTCTVKRLETQNNGDYQYYITGDPKPRNFGGDEIQILENGFTVDFAQMYNNNEAGLIGGRILVVDKNAGTYMDNVCEFDFNVSSERGSSYRLLFAPRAGDADSAEGIDVENTNGFLYINGSGWGNLPNLSGVTLRHGQDYHARVVTRGQETELYIDDVLATRYTLSGREPGPFGWGIWGSYYARDAAKKVTIKNIVHTGASYLKESLLSVPQSQWGKEDVSVPMVLDRGDAVEELRLEDRVLKSGEDYTLAEDAILLKSALMTPEAGQLTLTVQFRSGVTGQVQLLREVTRFERVWDLTRAEDAESWQLLSGTGTREAGEKGLRLTGDQLLLAGDSVMALNGEIELVYEPLNDMGQVGFLYRARDGRWQGVYNTDSACRKRPFYNQPLWNFCTEANPGGNLFYVDGSFFFMRGGRDYVLKLRYEGEDVTMWMDGQPMGSWQLGKEDFGQIGLRLGPSADILLKKVTHRNVLALEENGADAPETVLEKDGFRARLAGDFPRVLDYTLGGKTMAGSPSKANYVSLNGWDYAATATCEKKNDAAVLYHVTVPVEGERRVTFDVQVSLLPRNVLEMKLLNIQDQDFTVYTIGLAGQSLLSTTTGQACMYAANPARNSLATMYYDWFLQADGTRQLTRNQWGSIAILTEEGLSAALENNVLRNGGEFYCRSFPGAGDSWSLGLTSAEFLYKDQDGNRILPREDLYCRVILTEDTNGDGLLDWQDGANAMKLLVEGKIVGADRVRSSVVYIRGNFASKVQYTFTEMADYMKRISNLTDGFNQMMLFKGYANEGHDSGHCDYEDISTRAGTTEDFVTMLEESRKAGGWFGPHINHTEAYPEARMYSQEIASQKPGWAWLDQAYYIRRDADVLSGGMDQRLDEMFRKGDEKIGFVYVDTYHDGRVAGTRLAQNITGKHGVPIMTEHDDCLERWTCWTHLLSPAQTVHRFVYNQQKDVYGYSPYYRGGYKRVMWDNNVSTVMRQCYLEHLPGKYLMHHDVRKLDTAQGKAWFTDNVYTTSSSQIFKDDILIADGTGVFIPWFAAHSQTRRPDDADKIYCMLTKAETTLGTLPLTWQGLETVLLYRNTQKGRVLEDTLTVTDGKINLSGLALNVPYVLYPGTKAPEAQTTSWSVGSPVEDTGFNSRDFSIWQKEGKDVSFADDGAGSSVLSMKGQEAGLVRQTMKNLVPGQKYRVSVWAGAQNGKTAGLRVILPGGSSVENKTDHTYIPCNLEFTMTEGKLLQPVWVDFIAEEETAVLELWAGASGAEGLAQFMQVRCRQTQAPAPYEMGSGCIAWEDFEHVAQAYGIFSPEKGSQSGHLSQTHKPYTTDTISGDWSAKIIGHSAVRTTPATLLLLPNRQYQLDFAVMGSGTVYVVSESDPARKVLEKSFTDGSHSFTFTTGDKEDYILRFASNSFILDDVAVYDLSQAEADRKAAAEVDEKIAALGEVTLDSEEAIKAARQVYDELTEAQKKLVKNLAALEAAEGKLQELKDEATADEALKAAKAAAVEELNKIDCTGRHQKQMEAIREKAVEAIRQAESAQAVEAILKEAKENMAKAALCPSEDFRDVKADGWYHEAVDYAIEKGLMKGVSADRFSIDGTLTRGQLVTILYRAEGSPSVKGMENPFRDIVIAPQNWYAEAVIWACNNGIVKGVTDVKFAPMNKITREQLVSILYRYDGCPDVKGDLTSFVDADKVSAYARDAMVWGVENSIVSGIPSGNQTLLKPQGNATRAQAAAIMMRFLESRGE